MQSGFVPRRQQRRVDPKAILTAAAGGEGGEKDTASLANRCVFVCLKCGYEVVGYLNMKTHQRKYCPNENGGSNPRLRKLVQANYHKCRICSKTLLCDLFKVSRHLQWNHKMKLSEYRSLLCSLEGPSGGQKKEVKIFPTLSKKENLTLRKQTPAHPKFRTIQNLLPSAVPLEQTTFKVANLCTFKCLSCHTSFDSAQDTRALRHSCSLKQRYGNYEVTEARFHTCCLCSKRIVCDRVMISQHLRTAGHATISWQKYLDIASEKENLKDKSSTFGMEKKSALETEREEKLKLQVPAISPPLHEIYLLSDAYLPKDRTTSCIADLCIFQCQKCKSVNKSITTFRSHLKKCVK